MLIDKAKTDTIPTWKAEILRKEHTNAVLQQIRAEIEQTAKVYHEDIDYGRECGLQIALEIIDRYTKGENK